MPWFTFGRKKSGDTAASTAAIREAKHKRSSSAFNISTMSSAETLSNAFQRPMCTWQCRQRPNKIPEAMLKKKCTKKCICCGTKLEFPSGLPYYKCSICDTFHDLKLPAERSAHDGVCLTLDLVQGAIQTDLDDDTGSFPVLEQLIKGCFSSVDAINRSFPVGKPGKPLSFSRPNIDFHAVQKFYQSLIALPSDEPMKVLISSLVNLLKRLRHSLSDPGDFQFLLIILENPVFFSFPIFTSRKLSSQVRFAHLQPVLLDVLERTVGILAHCPKTSRHYLLNWLSRYEVEGFLPKVELMNGYVAHRLTLHYLKGYDDHQSKRRKSKGRGGPNAGSAQRRMATIGGLPRFAGLIHLFQRKHFGPHQNSNQHFYNSMVDFCDVNSDFDGWQALGVPSSILSQYHHHPTYHHHRDSVHLPLAKSSAFDGFDFSIVHQPKVAFCQYPFLLSMGSKTQILEYDAKRQMEYEAQEAFFGSLDRQTAPKSPFLYIRVNRESILQDSFDAFERHENDLKKGLRIEFINEPGIDAGGLKKEWFLLLIRKLFDPDTGVFVEDEESKYCWFDRNTDHGLKYYKLSGVAIGLALYNSTILDINFPPVLFKKLLGCAYTLDDFAQLQPSYGRSLQLLLEYEGDDFEQVFDMNFVITVPKVGGDGVRDEPLTHNGHKIPVTRSNRHEYVRKVMNYHLDVSIRRQFEAFKQGFYNVCGGNALTLFRPEEIEMLIRGSPEPLDIDSLKSITKYQHCSMDTLVVKWFWRFLSKLEPLEQRHLLMFVTGSDRIPATGMTNMSFKISCLGGNTDRLPTAHTCFNQLCLYEYDTRQRFEDKLGLAINNAQGFGIK